ncbi:hypothetical protein Csa_014323 [Cucumis sativus]|uniref:Uncharacterized protein n=1 Tax=Cucumis sativus TaxID=3659 RepID=A0A0A0LQT4_CUCSA|nr:hypothetical protein Csa_014323 [Cucumis sativus]
MEEKKKTVFGLMELTWDFSDILNLRLCCFLIWLRVVQACVEWLSFLCMVLQKVLEDMEISPQIFI